MFSHAHLYIDELSLRKPVYVSVSHKRFTVFPRIDAAAFIYFVVQFGAATIRGRRLFEGGVYYFGQYDRAPYTASLANSPSNYVDKLVWLIQETQHNNSQRTNAFQASFVPSTVSIWNHLPPDALTAPSPHTFKLNIAPLFS